jgi:hypothetical protein
MELLRRRLWTSFELANNAFGAMISCPVKAGFKKKKKRKERKNRLHAEMSLQISRIRALPLAGSG